MTHGKENLCMQSDMCHFRIPFTGQSFFLLLEMKTRAYRFVAPGSGISIFVIQSNDPLNSSMTIDSDAPVIASMSALPGSGNPLAYNVTLYSIQSLAATDHTLNIALLSYVYSNGTTKGSMIRFDSAAVNEASPTVVSPSASAVGTATPTSIVSGPSASTGASHSA